MFTGIGGFDLALQNLGHEVVGACEIDSYARSVFKKHFNGVPIYNDATHLHEESLPHFDLLSGGFPCQAFSIAGRRRGFDDTRGSLFFEIARLAKEKRPSYLLLENVKGLLSHDKGQTFRTIISTLDEVGYDVEWQLLNSKYHIPQNRERLFIIGHLRGKRRRQIFPLGDYDQKTDRKIKRTSEIIGIVNDKKGLRQVENSTCIDANYFKGHDNHGARTLIYTAQVNQNMKQKIQTRDDTWTLSTSAKDFGVMEDQRIRRLTPKECERLQGFPDDWTKYGSDGSIISDTQRYKMCGNAVTVPVVEFIARNFTD
jgi:DNA (cytosine-5)-methyltransferase 1